MWKWFKKKEKKNVFKFVKFSDGTAKENPDMIIREYRRLISEINNKIGDLYSEDYKLKIELRIGRVMHGPYDYKTEVKVSALEIIDYYEKIQREKDSQIKLLAHKKEIEDELRLFKSNYNYRRQW